MAQIDDAMQHIPENTPPEKRKFQLRANREHMLNAWLAGGRGNRWPGDDGRRLTLCDMALWSQTIKDAEAAHFALLDASYERAKAAHGIT